MELLSVLIVHSHPTFLRLLARYLEETFPDRIEVAACAFHVSDALRLAKAHQPGAVILGLGAADAPGLSLIPDLRRAAPASRVVVLAPMDDVRYRAAARDAGADACITKDYLTVDLIPALFAEPGIA